MAIITNTKILERIAKKFKCEFHPDFHYCTDSAKIESDLGVHRELARDGYKLQYIDGCFYPYLVGVNYG
jgi:hypothetical protein